jgi:hypothetical protein
MDDVPLRVPRFSLLLGEVGIFKARPLLQPDVSQITLLRDSVHS